MERGRKWLEIKIKPTQSDADVGRLIAFFRWVIPYYADIKPTRKTGKHRYQPDDQGEYTLRSQIPTYYGDMTYCITSSHFEATKATLMPDRTDVSLPSFKT
jgi:hypothetical protein